MVTAIATSKNGRKVRRQCDTMREAVLTLLDVRGLTRTLRIRNERGPAAEPR